MTLSRRTLAVTRRVSGLVPQALSWAGAGAASRIAARVAAYGLWGAFPLYWPLLEPAGAIEILAHRILWSMVTMGLLVVLRRWSQVRATLADRRTLVLLAVAALIVAFNWASFI